MDFKEKLKQIAREKFGVKSWKDKVDEAYENGVQVAAAPFARMGQIIGLTSDEIAKAALKVGEDFKNGVITREEQYRKLKELRALTDGTRYQKIRNREVAYDSSPRDIIRTDKNVFPIDISTDDQKAKVSSIKKFRNDNNIFDSSKEYIKTQSLDENGNVNKSDVKINRDKIQRFNDFGKPVDWQEWLKQKQEGKQIGEEIAKQFSGKNNLEKQKYNQIAAGINGANSYIPEGYTGKIYRLKNNHVKLGGETYVTEEQIKNLRPDVLDLNTITEVKPTKALGGQNTKYLDHYLHQDQPQDIDTMVESAKPIHYDENGNPYVRGFTWTQTCNIPKIMDKNSGYLASIGADTKEYHAGATPGHWTSEGWGNPMDKNYENNVAPGEIENFNLSDIEESLDGKIDMSNGGEWERLQELKERALNGIKGGHDDYNSYLMDLANKYNVPTSQNFDEQLLETRWPLKWYQKAPSEHQPNMEKVTIMNAGPSAKDVHRPVIKEVADSRSNREFEALQNEFMDRFQLPQEALIHQYRRKIDSEGWSPELEEWYKSERKKFTEDPDFKRMYELIGLGPKKAPTSVGTKVDKIATPSNMITAHMEDNMPPEWSMYDRSNGGQTIAGFHPNKKWSEMNANDFANFVKKNDPDLYDKVYDAAVAEGINPGKDKELHKFVGSWFMRNPENLNNLTKKLTQSKIDQWKDFQDQILKTVKNDYKSQGAKNPEELGKYYNPRTQAAIDWLGGNEFISNDVKTPYEFSFEKGKMNGVRIPRQNIGLISRGYDGYNDRFRNSLGLTDENSRVGAYVDKLWKRKNELVDDILNSVKSSNVNKTDDILPETLDEWHKITKILKAVDDKYGTDFTNVRNIFNKSKDAESIKARN